MIGRYLSALGLTLVVSLFIGLIATTIALGVWAWWLMRRDLGPNVDIVSAAICLLLMAFTIAFLNGEIKRHRKEAAKRYLSRPSMREDDAWITQYRTWQRQVEQDIKQRTQYQKALDSFIKKDDQ